MGFVNVHRCEQLNMFHLSIYELKQIADRAHNHLKGRSVKNEIHVRQQLDF